MVFDIILLGVQNPADTVSAPQSNSFIMLWFPFYFIFMDLFSVSRSTDTQCRGCGVCVYKTHFQFDSLIRLSNAGALLQFID